MTSSADNVATEVKALILETLPAVSPPDAVTDDARLGEEGLGFDSVAMVDLLCACEDHFGIRLPAEVLLEGDGDGGLTVAQLVAHVTDRVRDQTPRFG